jgi:AraC-like DNA-binding protein
MIAEVYFPGFPLNQFIDRFFYYKDVNPANSIDRFLPDGDIHLIFELSGNPQYIYDNDTLVEKQICKEIWFSGIRNKCISIPSGKDSEMFIIYFHKGQSYPFLEMPVDTLTDHVVHGQDVLPRDFLFLREELQNIESIKGKFARAEEYFIQFYQSKLILNPCVMFAVKQILSSPHQLTIKALSDKIGYSQKHFIHQFSSHVGLTPKGFLKVMRFQKAIQEIEIQKEADWNRVAHESGFYDQSHFINEFKLFSGCTPTEYLRMKSENLNYLAVG